MTKRCYGVVVLHFCWNHHKTNTGKIWKQVHSIYIIFGSLSLLVPIFGAYEGTYGAETTSGRARCQADTKSFAKCFFMSEKELLDIYGIDLSWSIMIYRLFLGLATPSPQICQWSYVILRNHRRFLCDFNMSQLYTEKWPFVSDN